jgi:CoA binding domain
MSVEARRQMDRIELTNKLDEMLYPSSVAGVGTSDIPVKWGNLILTSILGWEYKGKVFPVNPKKDVILGIKSYLNLASIPEEVDCAVLVVPARIYLQPRGNVLPKAPLQSSSSLSDSGRQEKIAHRLKMRSSKIAALCSSVQTPWHRFGASFLRNPSDLYGS